MSLDVANKGRTITITPNGGWTPGIPTYTEVEASAAEAEGQKILVEQISWTMAGCVLSGGVFVSGAGLMSASAQKVKCDGKVVMRLDDSGDCIGSFNVSGVPTPCSCGFRITDAGQTSVKGN